MFDTRDNVDAYHAARGNSDWAAVVDATRDAYILRATDWLSRSFTYEGIKTDKTQRYAFPRSELEYEDGTVYEGTPDAIKEATAIVADLYRQGFNLEGNINTTGIVKRRKIDVLETEFDTRISPLKAVVTPVLELLRESGLIKGQGALARV